MNNFIKSKKKKIIIISLHILSIKKLHYNLFQRQKRMQANWH